MDSLKLSAIELLSGEIEDFTVKSFSRSLSDEQYMKRLSSFLSLMTLNMSLSVIEVKLSLIVKKEVRTVEFQCDSITNFIKKVGEYIVQARVFRVTFHNDITDDVNIIICR